MAEKEGSRYLCSRSTFRYHHWKPNIGLTKKLKSTTQWFFYCILCQVVKMKILEYKDLGNGKIKAQITEVFPSGQIVDEDDPKKPLSELEVYSVDK